MKTRSEDKRRRILEAAQHCFASAGYDGTSMDQVAQEAGVSKQTVYSHFGSKETLFGAAVAARTAAGEITGDVFDDELPCREMLTRFAQRFVRLVNAPEVVRVYCMAIASQHQHPQIAQLFYQAGPAATIDNLTAYLERQQARGTLKIEDANRAAVQFLSMLKGEYNLKLLFGIDALPAPAQLEAYLEDCVTTFLCRHEVTTGHCHVDQP